MSTNHLAVLDLGSNSFHMVVAKVEENDNILIIDRIKEHVRLALGLDENKKLKPEAISRALHFLDKLHERLEEFNVGQVRVVGTDTLRKAKNGAEFLDIAQKIIGYPIEIISGLEEARLIYRAVSNSDTLFTPRLVIDIGGGSTEVVVGKGQQAVELTSTHMGCVSWTQKYFSIEPYTEEMFQLGKEAAKSQFFSVYRRIRKHTWNEVIGTSGTIRAISFYLLKNRLSDGRITMPGLIHLKNALCSGKECNGISHTRTEVIAGGLCILMALFESLRITNMTAHPFALREGVLFEIVGRMYGEDIREQSIWAVQKRFNVDKEQAERVEALSLHIFSQVQTSWSFTEHHKKILCWAARLHEIGMAIAFSGYQRHGEYILKHADLTGFTQTEQRYLSFLVLHHRGKLYKEVQIKYHPPLENIDIRLLAILRFASKLHRRRSHKDLPFFSFFTQSQDFVIQHSSSFPSDRPLSYTDMLQEKEQLKHWNLTVHIEVKPD